MQVGDTKAAATAFAISQPSGRVSSLEDTRPAFARTAPVATAARSGWRFPRTGDGFGSVAAPRPLAGAPTLTAASTTADLDPFVRLPRAPGVYGPSLVAVDRPGRAEGEVSEGVMMSDVDTCASCHPDAAAQWASSAHSFASFGNPVYRTSIEQVRADLGKPASQHCGGCHDMPLVVDGMLTADAPVPADDLRSHSGVTCRLCHGIASATADGNGSYVWNATPIDAPVVGDAGSIARHKRQVTTKLDNGLCIGCHRGFLSPDLGLPTHLTGIDEPGVWRNSACTGNGLGRIDQVERKTCIDCHVERVPASPRELGAKHGTLASHRFAGGHTWMAAMRDDTEQLAATRARLRGAASIDIAGARVAGAKGAPTWHLPADGAPVIAGTRLELDVVIRNLLVGHRFPGGVLDVQDTWVELEVADRSGRRLASSGLAHATDPTDQDAHVLRTLVVDDHGSVLEEHEVGRFRGQIATHTLEPREARAVRYAFAVPAAVQLPLAVTARLQHRSRGLQMQAATCKAARSEAGRAFIAGAKGARSVEIDPCKPQPITTVAQARVELGRGATEPGLAITTARPRWERMYEHGMALLTTTLQRLDEARTVLDAALAAAPDARSRAMVTIQLGWVAARQNRTDDALALVARSRALLASTLPPNAPMPAVFDAVTTEALSRAYRWGDAVAPAKACTDRAPQSSLAWSNYARVLVAAGDHATALAATARGLDLSPRDPELLRSQATAMAALAHPDAPRAQAAYTRFRTPDRAPGLRINCTKGSPRCARDRYAVQTIALRVE
jgi:hypothetical protein